MRCVIFVVTVIGIVAVALAPIPLHAEPLPQSTPPVQGEVQHQPITAQIANVAAEEGRQVCIGTYPTRLRVGQKAIVAPEPPLANLVRSQPTRTATAVGRIEPEVGMVILDGPVCADGWIWWYVRSEEGATGWTAEGDAADYWLEPVPKTPPSDARIYNLYSCLGPCQPDGSNSLGVFPEGTERIYLRWDYENIPSGADYVREWSMDGYEWIRYECKWPGPENGSHNISLLESSGLYSGVWEMRIGVNGSTIARTQLIVTGNHSVWEPVGVRTDCAEGVSPVVDDSDNDELGTRGDDFSPVEVMPFLSRAMVNTNSNVRTGPSTDYAKVTVLSRGTLVTVTGYNLDRTWYRLSDDVWIAAFLLDLCDSAYPNLCLPSPPPDLDCADVAKTDFIALSDDPHRLDGDDDGIACETSPLPWTVVPQVEPPPPPEPEEEQVVPAVCSCSGNVYNCRHFGTHAQAQACFNYCKSQGRGDVHRLDGDNDGSACESLP